MKQFKGWSDFSKDELVAIAKMLAQCAYGDISLNFNDTFAYASAWGVECDEFDLLAVTALFNQFGFDGVIAWGAIKEEVSEPIALHRYPRFHEAKAHILANKKQYFWLEHYKENKKESV